jgi:hypothetical protein
MPTPKKGRHAPEQLDRDQDEVKRAILGAVAQAIIRELLEALVRVIGRGGPF